MATADILKIILNLFEAAAAFTGICYWKKWKNTYWRWFIFFLVFILVTELTGKLFFYTPHLRKYNYLIYRYLNIPVTFIFYNTLFLSCFTDKNKRKMVRFFMTVYILSWLLEEFILLQPYNKYSTISFQVGATGILLSGIFYCVELIRSGQILYIKKDIMFWVVSGLVIYHIITLPMNGLRSIFWQNSPEVFWIYWYVSFFFNYIMYSFFIIALKWGQPK